jgi:hypothetical protein
VEVREALETQRVVVRVGDSGCDTRACGGFENKAAPELFMGVQDIDGPVAKRQAKRLIESGRVCGAAARTLDAIDAAASLEQFRIVGGGGPCMDKEVVPDREAFKAAHSLHEPGFDSGAMHTADDMKHSSSHS